ncbi:hypothetical protein ACWOFO_03735 [Carnobacterium maltaromaticum]
MRVYLSDIENTSKPTTYETKKISATILSNLVTISLQDFAKELTLKGKTAVLAEFTQPKLSKYTPIIGQKLVMLDFDNQDLGNQFTIDDLEQDQFIMDYACFFYKTFSDSESDVDKFRVAFKLDSIVTESETIHTIYQNLFERYPQADSSVGQTSRLFYGSTQGYELIDWDNELPVNHLVTASTKKINVLPNPDRIDDNTPNYLLLKYGKYDILQKKLDTNYQVTFKDEIAAEKYFCGLDMQDFLELPEGSPFIDILHNEINPSASVFYSHDYDTYLYKCFSEKSPFVGNILLLLVKYLGLYSKSDVLKILLTVTNSTIDYSSKIGNIKAKSNQFRKDLTTGKLQASYPELYHYLKRYIPEINATLDLMYDYVYTDSESVELRYLSYYSINRLAKNVGLAIGKQISFQKMWTVLSLMVVVEMIDKLPNDCIPKDLYTFIIEPQENNKDKIRTSNVYEPVVFNDAMIQNMSNIVKTLKENNVTVTSLSYELIYRLFGENKALKDFPQAYKPLVEKGYIKMSSKDCNLTNKSIQLEKTAVKLIMQSLDTKGYILESDLISALARNKNTKIATIKPKYIKIRSDIINKYGLSRQRMTRDLYTTLSVAGKYCSKVIIFRNLDS